VLVLVTDDNNDSRQLLVDIVSSMGHDLIEAANGIDALALAQSRLPDLIILDVTMPGMSGFDVCARLKSDMTTQQIPILMLTALSDVDHRVQGLKLGADDYLGKPFNPRELVERVRTRLRTKVETDELRAMQLNIRKTFERFVSPSVVEQLLHDPTRVQLGGRLQEVTVMFADLEGFTSISEYIEPVKLLTILNLYHTMMVAMIREHGGTVDKFMGDGVMALYNTPLEQPDHALRAVMTALHIRDSLPGFHRQFEMAHQMPINFGIHTGLAVVGNVGAPDIMNYTAVGDTVNLAARLQGLSAAGQILISSATREQLPEDVIAHAIGATKIKGRSESVMIYEIVGLPHEEELW
jgi:class 3 adenylate cyclase